MLTNQAVAAHARVYATSAICANAIEYYATAARAAEYRLYHRYRYRAGNILSTVLAFCLKPISMFTVIIGQ